MVRDPTGLQALQISHQTETFLTTDQKRTYLTTKSITQVEVFWVVTPCGVVVVYQRFGGPCSACIL